MSRNLHSTNITNSDDNLNSVLIRKMEDIMPIFVKGYVITSFCGCLVKEKYERCLVRFQRDSH